MMNKKRVTIKDIMREAEVSGTTVSRYLNGKFEYMSEDTRNRIARVIEELDYRPSNIARSLKSDKSMVIGAVIADIENHFSAQILKGLIDKANESGYSLMVSISNNDIANEKQGIERFIDNRVDGLIINTVGNNEVFLKNIQETIPTIFIDRGVVSFAGDTVTSNNYELGLDMMRHLLENNYRSIGFFTEALDFNTSRQERYRAFLDGAEAKAAVMTKSYVIDVKNEQMIIAGLKDFYQAPGPRVIFCGNGIVMENVLKAMKKEHFKLMRDFGVCGYDDWVWAVLVGEEGLTAIAQDSYAMGTESIAWLCEKLNQAEPIKKGAAVTITVQGKLNIRGSTKPMD